MPTYAQCLTVATDRDGFMLHPEDWNELIANHLAETDGIGSTQSG